MSRGRFIKPRSEQLMSVCSVAGPSRAGGAGGQAPSCEVPVTAMTVMGALGLTSRCNSKHIDREGCDSKYIYLWGEGERGSWWGSTEGGAKLFSVVPSKTRGSGHRGKYGKLQIFFLQWESLGSWMVCPERLWRLHPWRYSKPAWIRPQAACLPELVVSSRVGLDDLHRSLLNSVVLQFLFCPQSSALHTQTISP